MKLTQSYFLQKDVVALSKDLIGKVIFKKHQGSILSGIICETEAYNGIIDRASHAYGGKRSNRTESMYLAGGVLYVYLCYGIHKMLNLVANKEGIPEAILLRGIFPLEGRTIMQKNRGKNSFNPQDYIGPGKLSQALGIEMNHDRLSLQGEEIWLEDQGIELKPEQLHSGPRIGVDYAGEDADLPYRFQYHGFANSSI